MITNSETSLESVAIVNTCCAQHDNLHDFPDSRPVACHRLRCTERKIAKLDLVEKYNKKVSDYVKKGYADVVQDIRDLEGRKNLWYLPHQPWRSGKFKSWRHRKGL
jgi:hypothetical protein